MSKLRILSNVNWFQDECINNSRYEITVTKKINMMKSISLLWSIDFVIINISGKDLLLYSLLKLLNPFYKYKIISVDLILSVPNGIKEKIISFAKRILFYKVHSFILFMKDASGYIKHYKIDQSKLIYIPFKINYYPQILDYETEDKGYILTCGISKRDYATLFKSVYMLDCKVLALVPQNIFMQQHGSEIDYANIPCNVEVVHDDGSLESFVDYIAKSKLVVLPIKSDTISPTGVSTYLMAMALKKCVIISECPATKDILPLNSAVIVPPEDIFTLRDELIKVSSDEQFRMTIAENGYNYAVKLQGHQRLVRDILSYVNEIWAD